MRKRPNTKLAKVDVSLISEIQKIAAIRVATGKDSRYSPTRVQRKMTKSTLWSPLRNQLEIADFIDDEKAQMYLFGIFRFMIVAFIAVVLFGGLIFVMGILNDTFVDVGLTNEANSGNPGYVNLTQAANNTFGQVNQSIQALRLVAFCIIFAEILLIFVLNSFTKVHPAMFFVWVFIVFLAVLFSAPLSNAYESLLQQQIYGGLLETFTGANWMILQLPIIVTIVGIMGGVFMFINIVRAGGEQPL